MDDIREDDALHAELINELNRVLGGVIGGNDGKTMFSLPTSDIKEVLRFLRSVPSNLSRDELERILSKFRS